MKYKDFEFMLSGVYKMERGVKLYSLIIKKDNEVMYESPHKYKNEKEAFSYGKLLIKSMINANIDLNNALPIDYEKMGYDIIASKKSVNSYDKAKENLKKCEIVNSVIMVLLFIINVVLLVSVFFTNVDFEVEMIGILTCVMSFIILIVLYLNGFVYPDDGVAMPEKGRKIVTIAWWIQLLFGNGPAPSTVILDEDRKYYKNWSAIVPLLMVFLEALIGGLSIDINELFKIFYLVKMVLWLVIALFSYIWTKNKKFIKLQDEGFGYIRK